MKRRSKLIFSLVSLCFSIAVLCFGVYSALSVSYSISGNVSYEINDVFVELDLSVYRALSTTSVNSATHNQNVSTIKDAGDNISETDFGKLSYTDHKSTYDNGVVTNPGQEWSTSSSDLDLTYGSPTEDNQGYAFYIVIDIHNLGSEIINAQITAPTSLENTILRDSGNVEITADGTERIVLGLALDDVTLGIDQVEFTYTITISRGELPIELITDMTFTVDEENKTATLTSYTGSDTVVEIPETIGSIKQTTKTFGQYANIYALIISLAGTSTGMVDMFLVGDISYTSGNEQKVDKNQMIYSWIQDSNNASCTNITIECKSSYTLTLSEIDMENEFGALMLYGPAAGYIFALQQNPTILDSMSMSYKIRINNEEFYVDKNAVMQAMESNSGELAEYMLSLESILGSSMEEITISFEDIIYGGEATEGDEYTVTSIGPSAFSSCSNLTSIEIPSSVTSIGEDVFRDCSALETVTFGANSQLESIGFNAFYSCYALTSIEIPSSVTSIGDGAFYNCDGLETVTFGENSQLESIGYSTFSYCSNLTSIEIPSGVTSIGDSAFYNCDALETVTFGANSQLESIGSSAFSSCSNLTSIEIPSRVTSIGSSAFSSCYALAEVYNYSTHIPEVTIGNSSSSTNGCLGEYAKVVYNPSDLTGEKPASRIQTWGDVQYYVYGEDFIALAPSVARDSLTTLTLDGRTTEINTHAFADCDALTSIEIPSRVTSIGSGAFYGCYTLETVTFEDTESVWILDNTSNTEISISEHTPQVLADYLTSTYRDYTWTKKQSA